MSREQDEAAAVALGWKKHYSPDPTIWAWERPDGQRISRADLPLFSVHRSAASLLLDRIERHGLQDEYLIALTRILERDPLPYPSGRMPPFLWQVLRATPEQQTEAFLLVVGDGT